VGRSREREELRTRSLFHMDVRLEYRVLWLPRYTAREELL